MLDKTEDESPKTEYDFSMLKSKEESSTPIETEKYSQLDALKNAISQGATFNLRMR